jgi:hypothetical protein
MMKPAAFFDVIIGCSALDLDYECTRNENDWRMTNDQINNDFTFDDYD